MRQTLFYIPHEIYGLPLFGFGWLLIVWAVASALALAVMLRKHGWSEETKSFLPLLAVIGLVIGLILPLLEEGSHGGPFAQLRGLVAGEPVESTLPPPLGLPIRGYGVMMLMGVLAGVGLAAQRARRMGLNPEVIYSLAFFMFLGGIAGARGFYVLQKWDEFRSDSLVATVGNILKFTEGGLVVYGSLIGGLLAAVWFCSRKRLPMLAIGDLIAPSLVVGLAFGRSAV
jgi:phosphatidylglycerol---prolipoprotein diacylglyceryl transferase